jgi:peroxiredoxin Q/BCP
MKVLVLFCALSLGCAGLALAGGGSGKSAASDGEGALEAGMPAPDFSLPGSDGETHILAEHRGKRAVVVAWFPKAFTGG